MTEETRKKIHQVADYINKDPLFFLDGFDWGYITGGFENEEISELIYNISDDDSVKMAIDCISQSWYEALEHFDPVCYDDDNNTKFNESYSINYVLEKIRKKRNIHIRIERHKENNDDKKEIGTFDDVPEITETHHDKSHLIKMQARIEELETESQKLKAENEELKTQLQKLEALSKNDNEMIVELLAHLCFEDEQVARDILNDIRGKEDPVIADIIVERKKRNQISPKTQNREIWKILHAAKLYQGIEGNFNTALRRRQQR